MKSFPSRPTLIAAVLAGAIRVTLGVLWLHEGTLKYRAHFGAADILLVANSAKSNSRVPGYFKSFADFALAGWPHFFGFAMPLLETALGVVLVLGVFTLPASFMSAFTLLTYWSADQLITEYPIMVALSTVVIAWPLLASHFSVTTLAERAVGRRRPDLVVFREPFRRWL
ncbi:DoxX family membrane protein [Streptomyces sp. MBT65]|uniref:DoxX family membrane protein n=1 Tax=Streptomyces sp. MBT65 TaxID=1488395 RepID=UPI00190CA68B|nr:DoxX family membrane protein [Streptomyces sp. MBT65]MBK3572924.1 DoxX family membrane protein [Streptomyces sp. MBT65]